MIPGRAVRTIFVSLAQVDTHASTVAGILPTIQKRVIGPTFRKVNARQNFHILHKLPQLRKILRCVSLSLSLPLPLPWSNDTGIPSVGISDLGKILQPMELIETRSCMVGITLVKIHNVEGFDVVESRGM